MKVKVTYQRSEYPDMPVWARVEMEIDGKKEILWACGKDVDDATSRMRNKIPCITETEIAEPREIEV